MSWQIITGDCRESLRALPSESVHTCVTSPPYFGLRDYGHDGQIGTERNLAEYVMALCNVFKEVRRVLRDDGTLWLNLGDSYDARKSLMGVPWKVAQRLKQDGWILRSEIIWHKPSPMPESVTDRPTKAHEQIFLLVKRPTYFYNSDAIREGAEMTPQRRHAATGFGRKGVPGRRDNRGTQRLRDEPAQEYAQRNRRTVWTVATQPYAGAHFATFPPKLIEPCILAGCPEGGTVLDPFAGAGTTGMVALRHGRSFIGCELNPTYAQLARDRIIADCPLHNTGLEVAA